MVGSLNVPKDRTNTELKKEEQPLIETPPKEKDGEN